MIPVRAITKNIVEKTGLKLLWMYRTWPKSIKLNLAATKVNFNKIPVTDIKIPTIIIITTRKRCIFLITNINSLGSLNYSNLFFE